MAISGSQLAHFSLLLLYDDPVSVEPAGVHMILDLPTEPATCAMGLRDRTGRRHGILLVHLLFHHVACSCFVVESDVMTATRESISACFDIMVSFSHCDKVPAALVTCMFPRSSGEHRNVS
jgi:hypothetical protein